MLLKLLRRDLRLHWDAMILPFLILILAMGAVGLSSEAAAVLGTVLIGALFVPFLPLAIHLREQSQGTLPEVLAGPVPRRSLVVLRYLEVLLFAGAMIALGHLGSWIALCASAHGLVPMAMMDKSALFPISALLLICFAYPMPFMLRWDGKGLAAAFALFASLSVILWWLLARFGTEATGRTIARIMLHLLEHPGQVAIGFLGLFALSYPLSLKAATSRDF